MKWFDGGLLFGGFALLTVGELRRAGVRLRSGQRSGSGSAFRDHSLADLQSRGEDAEMKLNTFVLRGVQSIKGVVIRLSHYYIIIIRVTKIVVLLIISLHFHVMPFDDCKTRIEIHSWQDKKLILGNVKSFYFLCKFLDVH